jgi:hypothetical protein
MKRLLLSLPLSLLFLVTIHSTPLVNQQETATPKQVETTYDEIKDKTTVRLLPVPISSAKAQYHSVHNCTCV